MESVEEAGRRHRIHFYYGPLFMEFCRLRGLAPHDVRVLDCAPAGALSVDLLAGLGFEACGLSVSSDQPFEALPFPKGQFDIVLSSGVFEHFDAAGKIRFLSECFRVLCTGGVIYMEHPNGVRGLPSYGGVKQLAESAAPHCRIEALSPARRFPFRHTGRRWYGKLAAALREVVFRAMAWRPLRWLAHTALNPYLVLRISRS